MGSLGEIILRPFRNDDVPVLSALWNRALPFDCVARPLHDHEWDAMVCGSIGFDRRGLIVAVLDGRIVGYVHAGFGPSSVNALTLQLCYDLGSIVMLVVDPAMTSAQITEISAQLLAHAETYLRERGAKVIYAGGLYPLTPFYWGIYGGSELAGILAGHETFHDAVRHAGFEPIQTALVMEADLTAPERRDPRSILLRKKCRLEITEDYCMPAWWDSLSYTHVQLTRVRLLSKDNATEYAQTLLWDMERFGRVDNCTRYGIINFEVFLEFRRKGFGRHLLMEIMRSSRLQLIDRMMVQTLDSNRPAIALYQSLGFQIVTSATTYRKPSTSTPASVSVSASIPIPIPAETDRDELDPSRKDQS